METASDSVPVNKVFIEFTMWLQSADGGQLDAKTSEQKYKQVLMLLSIVDEKKNVAYYTLIRALIPSFCRTLPRNIIILRRHCLT